MSYAVGPTKPRQTTGMGAYAKINASATDIEAFDPLIQVNLKKNITQQLVQIKNRQR